MKKQFVIGDLHGHLDQYQRLLRDAGFCDQQLRWTGGDQTLWLIGDLFDRGIEGIGCLDLTMELQQQAEASHGSVRVLLGNHELMLLCAYKFRDEMTSAGMRVTDQWLTWGGVESDLMALTPKHIAWLSALPALHKTGSTLLMHADAMMYISYGRSVQEVNDAFVALMQSDDLMQWEAALYAFTEHRAFSQLTLTGSRRAQQILTCFGADRLIHGHTPIPFATHKPSEQVTEAWCYANGLCINVDGGIYLGGPGFVHPIDDPGSN